MELIFLPVTVDEMSCPPAAESSAVAARSDHSGQPGLAKRKLLFFTGHHPMLLMKLIPLRALAPLFRPYLTHVSLIVCNLKCV